MYWLISAFAAKTFPLFESQYLQYHTQRANNFSKYQVITGLPPVWSHLMMCSVTQSRVLIRQTVNLPITYAKITLHARKYRSQALSGLPSCHLGERRQRWQILGSRLYRMALNFCLVTVHYRSLHNDRKCTNLDDITKASLAEKLQFFELALDARFPRNTREKWKVGHRLLVLGLVN